VREATSSEHPGGSAAVATADDVAAEAPGETSAARGSRAVTPLAAGAVAVAALALYRTTLLPGVGFWDTAEAQTVLPLLGTMHPTGFPAFVIIGWLFSIVAQPLGQPAFLMNLLAAVCAALAAGGVVMVSRRLSIPLPIGIAAAAGFAVTPIVWQISTAIDAHALHILLVVGLTLALLRWQALVDGRRRHPGDDAFRRKGDRAISVAAANHGLALILAPSIALFVLAVEPTVVRRPRLVVAAIGTAVGVAALLYLELPLRAGLLRAPLVYAHPDTWQGFWDVVLARQFQGDVHGLFANLGQKVDALVALGGAQLGPLLALVPAGFFVAAVRQPKYALFSGTAVLVTVTFAGSYSNADITRYYLGPLFFVWTWVALLAATLVEAVLPGATVEDASESLAGAERRRRVARSITLAVVFGVALLVPTAFEIDARWKAVDQSGNIDATVWLDEAFGAMSPDAVVVSWWGYSTTMWYGELVEGRRTDIQIIDDSNIVWDKLGTVSDVIDHYLGTRPVYVIRLPGPDLQNLAEQYAIQPVDRPENLFLVTGRLGTTP
jgi:hypothetical protein